MNTVMPVQVDSLFDSVGLQYHGVVYLNENTYDFDPLDPKNHWLYGAFLAFLRLRNEGFNPHVFATIGTSSGTDSIGAYEIFHPAKIFQTDIHTNVIAVAESNVSSVIGSDTSVETLLGDLCTPLIERGIKVDLLYANIPNIPSLHPVLEGKKSSSRFNPSEDSSPEKYSQWLLALQYRFLTQAKKVLNPSGVIAIAIGDRVPSQILEELFADTGYVSSELVNIYKKQTEPEEVLVGYAEQESQTDVEFDFYDHEKAVAIWQNECEGKDLSIEKIKTILLPFRISATEALRNWREQGRSAGHVYSIFKLNSR